MIMFLKTKDFSIDRNESNFSHNNLQTEKRMQQRSKSFETQPAKEIRLKEVKSWLFKKVEIYPNSGIT